MSERPDYQEPLPDDAEYPADEDDEEPEQGEEMPLGSDNEVDPPEDDRPL